MNYNNNMYLEIKMGLVDNLIQDCGQQLIFYYKILKYIKTQFGFLFNYYRVRMN